MLRRRTTAGDNFLTSSTQNYCYIFNKLGTLTLKASTRFLRVGKNLGLQKQQIAHCCKKFCYSRRKMFNSKTEQRIKGGESSSQFRWFTIAKIELEFLIFLVLILGLRLQKYSANTKRCPPKKSIWKL